MKLTTEQREELDKKRRSGAAYSDLLIYGAVRLGTARYSPAVSKTARVELSRASSTPATLAKILERYAAKPSVPGAMLEIICVVVADGFTKLAAAKSSAKHVDGAVACATALQQLLARPRSLPIFGEDAISGLVAFWLASKPKPAKLTTVLDQLIPDEVSDELASRVAEYRKASSARPKRA